MPRGRASVCVVGSLMFDIVMRVPRRPARGETMLATDAGLFLGGKGFNQAIGARRLGAAVCMVGRVGDDPFGTRFLSVLAAEGVDTEHVSADPEFGTGIATPLIEADGSNSIVISLRANSRVTPGDVARAAGRIRAADVLLLQLEIPVATSLAAAAIARAAGVRVVLNPAPALAIPDALLAAADAVTPNEVEAAVLSGQPVEDVATAVTAAQAIRARGPGAVVVTLGEQGAVLVADDRERHLPAHTVAVVDTTAAGDAFTAAFAVRLTETGSMEEALAWGNAAGALAVTRLGAEPALPGRDAVERLWRHNYVVP